METGLIFGVHKELLQDRGLNPKPQNHRTPEPQTPEPLNPPYYVEACSILEFIQGIWDHSYWVYRV